MTIEKKLIPIVPDAVERYSISKPTIYKLIKRGIIKPVKIGRSTRIDVAQADRVLLTSGA